MKRLGWAVVLVAGTLGLSACGSGHKAISSGPHKFDPTLPAPLVKQLAAEAKSTARSLGDTSVKTAQVYGPDSRYALVKASSSHSTCQAIRRGPSWKC